MPKYLFPKIHHHMHIVLSMYNLVYIIFVYIFPVVFTTFDNFLLYSKKNKCLLRGKQENLEDILCLKMTIYLEYSLILCGE